MNITPEQLSKIRSALWLAGYFVSDTSGGSQVEQWETDRDTVKDAWDVIYKIETGITK
jgi:hypothetical protein